MTNQQIRDEAKLKGALARAKKDGNSKMISWCEQQLDYFEAFGEIKDKYPDSTLVMRKQFVDIAVAHEWNHGRPVGEQLAICTELNPMCDAGVISKVMANRLITSIVPELEKLITKHAPELGKLYVRVSFYKEPRR